MTEARRHGTGMIFARVAVAVVLVAGLAVAGYVVTMKIADLYGGAVRAYNDDGACFEFTVRDYER